MTLSPSPHVSDAIAASVAQVSGHLVFPEWIEDGLRRVRLLSSLAILERDAKAEDTSALAEQSAALESKLAGSGASQLGVLRTRLGLGPLDELALFAAMALEHDPLFTVTASALLGEEPRYGVTARLVALLGRFSEGEGLALGLGPQHPLVRTGLLEACGPDFVPATLRGYRLPERVTAWLCGSDVVDAELRLLGAALLPAVEEVDQERVVASDLVRKIVASGESVSLVIEGNDGSGRSALVAHALHALGVAAIRLDAARMSTDRTRAFRELRRLRLECWLRHAIPVISGLDGFRGDSHVLGDVLAEVFGASHQRGPLVVTGGVGVLLPELGRRVLRVTIDPLTSLARARAWEKALGGCDATPELRAEVPQLASQFALGLGAIERVVANARILAEDVPIDSTTVRAGLAAELKSHFSGLAIRIPVTQSWNDLVLPQDTRDDVTAFVARTGHAPTVYDKWGFRDKLGRGLGLAALFSGPPGTGKTMVAGLIAKELGLDLYVVDLSQIVSKWVGETEKHLGRVFDGAAAGNVLLLFDEADALFAQRTEVKSSNDRYANLEVNYLLTKLEQFSGVAILTTNLEGSVDPAVARRMAAHIRFYPPDEAERALLWQRLIPQSAPTGAIDFDGLAAKYGDLAGGHIRNAVLRAAFLAAQEGGVIDDEVLGRAAHAEYRAMGKML